MDTAKGFNFILTNGGEMIAIQGGSLFPCRLRELEIRGEISGAAGEEKGGSHETQVLYGRSHWARADGLAELHMCYFRAVGQRQSPDRTR